ncbi:MAG: hypothetical protein HYU39_03400 [Thaumarchaeota archaeon]|nr:hypothetical protein [Nitrososphaerota archaeon]
MSSRNLSVPAAVASIVTHNPAVYECLKQKIVNYHALAANIKPEVEKQVGKPASINTIVVALTRFSDTITKVGKPKPLLILREARITLASDVVDVTIKSKKFELFQIVKRIADLSSSLNEPIHLFQLSNSIKLIADEREYNSLIHSSLDKILIARETARLSRLAIHLSAEVETTPEFGFFLTELLYRHGIKLRHTYIGEETILILGRDDGPKAYEILRQEIDRSRTALPKEKIKA